MKSIPQWLEELKKTLSSGLKDNEKFIKCFNKSVKYCGNVEKIKAPFLIFVLKSTLDKFDHTKYPDVKKVVDTVIGLYETGETDVKKFEAARAASRAAANRAADAAAWAAAWAADAARWAAWAADAAGSAASAAANAAADAAGSAASAAANAAGASRAYAAYAAAKQQEYDKFANKLLDLMKEQEYTPAQKEIANLLKIL